MDSSSEDEFTSSRVSSRRSERPARVRATRKGRTEAREVRASSPEREPEENSQSDKVRKAPTPFAENKSKKRIKNKKAVTLFAILFVGLASSAGISLLDGGQIDVEETIEARNERIKNNTPNESDTIISNVEVPVQDTTSIQKKADGGLKGRGTGGTPPTPPPAPEVASSTASSTESATSTEATTEEVSE